MDEVFGALNDSSRRLLLDELNRKDGQALGELCSYLPEMTRFGVMNHLRVLEEAGLITTRKEGRRKLHYLNPVPIRLVHDRWITKYTEPVVGAMSRLKASLEGGKLVGEPAHVYQMFINVEPTVVFNALIDGEMTKQYFYGTTVESDWEVGSEIRYVNGDGSLAADGEVIAIDPPNRIEMTFTAHWDPVLTAEGATREHWLVEESNGMSKLTVELYDAGPKTLEDFVGGFPYIFSGLKTLLETGASLPAPS